MAPPATPGSDYLTIQQAADYIGTSMQTLRRWDAAGRLKPVRHPANGYRYYRRDDLEPFRIEYRAAETTSAGDIFQSTANIEGNKKLRDPQREAHRRAREHFETSNEHAVVQIPVACGKTGIMATLPFGIAVGRVLVITPNLTLRTNVFETLDVTSPKCFWKRTGVLASLERGPYLAVLDGEDANVDDCVRSHFVVTNIQQLASSADRWLPRFPPNFFDMILVDEGHHNVATSWRRVFERFPHAKVVSLTATPFRSDEKRVDGQIIYRYPFTQAMMSGYIKRIVSANVAPSELFFTYHGEERRHTLDEVLALREEQWFRRGVALAEECNRNIVDLSIKKLRLLRARTGFKHQIIAVACSVDHARQVRSLYEERALKAHEIHSAMDAEKQDEVLEQLRQGRLDCVVQVQMLGEGFDHPPLSVAAVFRPYRSLSPYIQFVGRIMRVVHPDQAGHPDNIGVVVSHVGLNNDEHWNDFREFDLDEQGVVHRWLTEEGDDELAGDKYPDDSASGQPRRFDQGMIVSDEIVGHFLEAQFLDPDDDRVLDKMLAQPIPGTGLTWANMMNRDALRAKLKEQMASGDTRHERVPVSPQRRRQAVRARVHERANSVAARIVKDLGFAPGGREVGRVDKSVAGRPNRVAVIELLNRRVNAFVGIEKGERAEMTKDQAEKALKALDRLGDEVRDEIDRGRKKARREGAK
jgi:superfamily II DNA or RNA helicase